MKDNKTRSQINTIPNKKGYGLYGLSNRLKLQELKIVLANTQFEYEVLLAKASGKKTEINRITEKIKKSFADK